MLCCAFQRPVIFLSFAHLCPLFSLQAVSVTSSSVVGLVQAVGVSSSFVAQKTQGGKEGREELLSVEEFDYWNLWNYKGWCLFRTRPATTLCMQSAASATIAMPCHGGNGGSCGNMLPEAPLQVLHDGYLACFLFRPAGVSDANFGDGGSHDNQAITPVLQTSITTQVSCYTRPVLRRRCECRQVW
jgi:hypothetical protein